mmetsp:Transcript_6398/g.7179  ORF Transcript_6398/g.7179 Transcript_6398/m.7179 type:complete len:238 (-) Transcript_6398:157-870(-)
MTSENLAENKGDNHSRNKVTHQICDVRIKACNNDELNEEDEYELLTSPLSLATNETKSDGCDKGERLSDSIEQNKKVKRQNMLRKASVAVGGGALVTVGVPLIPVFCVGEVMIIGGMALLATEFDSAKSVLNKGREKLDQFASADDEKDNNDGDNNSGDDIVYVKVTHSPNEGECSEASISCSVLNECEEEKRYVKMLKSAKKSLRGMVKNDILPLMDKYVMQSTEHDDEKSNLIVQ